MVGLPPGTYQVVTTLRNQEGKQIGRPYSQSLDWPGQPEEFKAIRILNNLVWELLGIGHKPVDGTETFLFKSPKRRWVYVAATARKTAGRLRISVEKHKDIIVFAKDEKGTKESRTGPRRACSGCGAALFWMARAPKRSLAPVKRCTSARRCITGAT